MSERWSLPSTYLHRMSRIPRDMRCLSHVLVLACALSSSGGCAMMPAVRLDQGRVQTNLQALEGDVLDDAKKFRQLLEDSGAVYDDPALQAYLDRLFQPLAPTLTTPSPYQFRLKVVRDPTLNAYTLGDGSIYVNTGLIARLKTAQQLAFVLGHEGAHVMNRDLVYFTDGLRRKTVAAKLTGLVVTPALSVVGLGGLGELGVGLAYAASVTGYGREREALADEESLKTMQRLGFDEREAGRVLQAFLAEEERYQRGMELGFLSSHPSNEARLADIKALMGAKALDIFSPEVADGAFLRATHPLRIDNAALNIQFGRPYHAVEDLQIILRRSPNDARARFHLAEAYRLIAEEPKQLKEELSAKAWQEIKQIAESEQKPYWHSRAREEYQRAVELDPRFPDSYRGLGLLCAAQDQPDQAVAHLQRYLELSPQARDRRYVVSLIASLAPVQPPSQAD